MAPGSDLAAAFARALACKPPLGLARGAFQVGQRVAHDPAAKVVRSWVLADVPKSWSDEAVLDALVYSDFEEPQLSWRIFRHGALSWYFRARTAHGEDVKLVEVSTDDNTVVHLWAKLAVSRPASREVKTINVKGAGKGGFLASTKKHLDTEKVTVGTSPSTQPGNGSTSPEADPAGRQEGAPPAKRKEVSRNVVPKSLTRVPIAPNGNCLVEALARGMAKIPGAKKMRGEAVRAEIVAHLRKNNGKYTPGWDGLDADGLSTGISFETYVDQVNTWGKHMGAMEIAAATRVFDICVVMLSEATGLPNRIWHSSSERMVVLWYSESDKHYDLLEGEIEDGILQTCEKGITVGLRGGGDDRARIQCVEQPALAVADVFEEDFFDSVEHMPRGCDGRSFFGGGASSTAVYREEPSSDRHVPAFAGCAADSHLRTSMDFLCRLCYPNAGPHRRSAGEWCVHVLRFFSRARDRPSSQPRGLRSVESLGDCYRPGRHLVQGKPGAVGRRTLLRHSRRRS